MRSISDILLTLTMGVAATACMTLFLYAIQWLHIINGDIMRTIGSLFTHTRSRYLRFALAVHFVTGALLALLYSLVFQWTALGQPFAYVAFGGMLGWLHGILVSYGIMIFAGEHHRSRSFRRQGVAIAAIDWMAHIVYGCVLGYLYALWLVRT